MVLKPASRLARGFFLAKCHLTDFVKVIYELAYGRNWASRWHTDAGWYSGQAPVGQSSGFTRQSDGRTAGSRSDFDDGAGGWRW
jgi:hypothetical protein